MMKKYISIIVIILVLLNIPSITLRTLSIGISSPISYFTFLLLGLLIITNNKKYPKKINFFAAIISVYYFIGMLNYDGDLFILLINYIKSLLYVFGLFVCLKHVNMNTLLVVLVIGGTTIILDSLFFRFNDFVGDGYISEYGRYGGFYLNPNIAAIICLLGYILFLTRNDKWRVLSILFTFFGILTLSRTFILTWIISTIIYLYYNRKDLIYSFLFITLGFFGLLSFSEALKLDSVRFNFLTDLLIGNVNEEVLNDDSRQAQWAKFYDGIIDAPFFGNGYFSFSTSLYETGGQGVHNSFLLIFGESGLLPFLLIIILFGGLFYSSFRIIRENCKPFILTIVLSMTCLVSHNLFNSGIIIFTFVLIISSFTEINNKYIL